MPGLNPADYKISSGELDRPLMFYTVNPALDPAGGVLDPASQAVNPIFAYQVFGGLSPYNGVELRDALTKVGEQWTKGVIRYSPSRLPKEGMRMVDKWSGDEYEITGVQPIGSKRLRVELTCRKLT